MMWHFQSLLCLSWNLFFLAFFVFEILLPQKDRQTNGWNGLLNQNIQNSNVLDNHNAFIYRIKSYHFVRYVSERDIIKIALKAFIDCHNKFFISLNMSRSFFLKSFKESSYVSIFQMCSSTKKKYQLRIA